MAEVVIVDAVRTPVGRRNGGLSTVHPADLLGTALTALMERTGIDPADVQEVVAGCVSQVGEQSFNIARTAWLAAGLPLTTPAATVDTQCGSSQHATNLAASLIAAGAIDMAVAAGVESMTRIPIGSSSSSKLGLGRAIPKSYFDHHELTSQFEGAERIARKWGITRDDTDAFGLRSQQLAARAWAEGRFDTQVVPVSAPPAPRDGNGGQDANVAPDEPAGEPTIVSRDEGLRDTTAEALAGLKPVLPDGIHTAGTSSQISDGAAAVLLATPERAAALGLTPRARIAHHCLVGVDPVLMLTGPIDATNLLLERADIGIGDVDLFEINEAFASVVLAWQKELKPDPATVNPVGGAIALGHPLGGTGVVLITKAVHELERTGGRRALVSMCCGGGLGTGTLIER
ncbi:MAG: steroid 3-ketoacyl-CoA thiolase [Acidimicrobiales bacterium]